MPRSVYEIEDIFLTILRFIDHAHGLSLDGDAALTLQVHIIKNLLFHLPRCQNAGFLQ